jgi:hypothetical protein
MGKTTQTPLYATLLYDVRKRLDISVAEYFEAVTKLPIRLPSDRVIPISVELVSPDRDCLWVPRTRSHHATCRYS